MYKTNEIPKFCNNYNIIGSWKSVHQEHLFFKNCNMIQKQLKSREKIKAMPSLNLIVYGINFTCTWCAFFSCFCQKSYRIYNNYWNFNAKRKYWKFPMCWFYRSNIDNPSKNMWHIIYIYTYVYMSSIKIVEIKFIGAIP